MLISKKLFFLCLSFLSFNKLSFLLLLPVKFLEELYLFKIFFVKLKEFLRSDKLLFLSKVL